MKTNAWRALAPVGAGAYNQVLGGHPYLVQTEWSNALAAPQGLGCVGNGVDRAPTARIRVAVQGGNATFDCTSSTDPDPGDSITSCFWEFGDFLGTTGTSPRHNYAAAGTYHVRLLASDSHGATSQAEQDVVVSSPTPAPTHSFTLDLNETIDSDGASGAGNMSGLGKVISLGFEIFDYANFSVSVEFVDPDLEVGKKPPGSTVGDDIVYFSNHVTLTDTANPPAGNNYSLAGTFTIQGGTGAYRNATGSGTITGSCTSSFTSDVVNCIEHWKGLIGGN